MDRSPAADSVRFAARVIADPARAVSRWKAVSGWRTAGCVRGFPVPEVLHAVELLPVVAGFGEDPGKGRVSCDAWVCDPATWVCTAGMPSQAVHFFPDRIPAATEDVLALIEGLAEWAASVTGRRCTEGALERSLRAYDERDARLRELAARCRDEPGFIGRRALGNVVGAGDYLPVECHARLLSRVLGEEASRGGRAEDGDPFLLLALKVRAARGATAAGYHPVDF